MVLIFDSGNSFLKATIYSNDGKEIKFAEIENKKINKFFFNELVNGYDVSKCYIGSVTPSLIQTIKQNINDILNIESTVIKQEDFSSEFDLSKFNKNKIGSDILAYALYIKKTYGSGIGFCFGTALFAVGVTNNTLHGAMILPPIESGLKLLEQNAEMIDLSDINKIDKNYCDFGYNTATAIISAINHAYNGIVISACNYFNKKFSLTNLCITGGNYKKIIPDKEMIPSFKIDCVKNAVTKGYAYLIFKN